MARPKKHTPEGKIASEKWRQTMIETYGSVTDKMREAGRIGGQNGKGPDYKGGFAASKEHARKAGAKGGSISRRKSKYNQVFEENRSAIEAVLRSTATVKDLAKALGVPYSSLLHYINKYVYDK